MQNNENTQEGILSKLNNYTVVDLLAAASSSMAIIDVSGQILVSNSEFKNIFPPNTDLKYIQNTPKFKGKLNSGELLSKLENGEEHFSILIENVENYNYDLHFKSLGSDTVKLFYVCSVSRELLKDDGSILQQLANNIPVAIFIKDVKGRFMLANNWLAKLMNVDSAEALVGKTDFDIHPKELAKKYFEDEQEIIRTGCSIVNKEEQFIVNDKKQWCLSTKIPYYDSDGSIKGVMGISRDITKTIEKTRAIKQAMDKAEKADMLKSTFLANLSHEIRTPLNGIIGFSQFLLQKEHSKEKRDKYLATVYKKGKQLLFLINDILDISMIDSKQLKLNYNVVRINPIIEQVKANLEQEISENGLSLSVSSKLDLIDGKDKVYSDSVQITKILNNLMSNALKFSRKGQIELGYLKKHDYLEFFVKDEGIGIDTRLHKEIFSRFKQVDESATRSYGGTGLGLAICKGLVDILGGKIWVESEKKKGSTFYFTIPLVKKSDAAQ